ncbi:MAG: oligopeptidase Metallo peptidase, family [Bacteroidetes bacterium]|nr:oligopeptidase Metallo peptidase, family [Bacteroidota bacterium]
MSGNIISRLTMAMVVLVVSVSTYSEERSKIPDKYKWKLADIYPSNDAWKKAREELVAQLPDIEKFKGTLNQSPAQLLACLDLGSKLNKEFIRVSVYAGMLSDQDTRDATHLAMTQEIGQIGADFGAKTAFLDPEILKMDKATIEAFMQQEKKLGIYRQYIDDLQRRKAHTGTEGEEKILADASLMSDAASSVNNVFSNAEFPFPRVTLNDGKTVKIDKAGFNRYRAVTNREDRKKVFAAYLGEMQNYRRTFGTQLYGEVKKNMFYARARNYESSLHSALDGSNIPVQVYHSLVDNVNKNLATFHRYLNLRKRILGVDTLHYYDLYAPMVASVDIDYPIEESEKHILASFRPLGNDYTAVVKKALNERWIDLYPNDGKRAGAYSNGGAYDVHPYMLLNYNGKYNDMSTLAHELGHTMQSYLSNKNQPYPTARYPIFVAEVASTFNEALLIDHMLKTIKDDNVRLSMLGDYLDGIRGTVFRQTQFAEFEMRIHEMAEKGDSPTGDRLNDLYTEITKRYYGHDKGVCIVDDEIKAEWMNIPHFFYNFYVYQYATAFTASSALSEQVLAGDKTATKKYLDFLSAGSSDYAINLLKKAGVDMTTSQPFELTMKKMNRVMDEMETILKKMGK